MKNYSLGDIVLVTFAFADTSQTKRRPGLVLLDTGDEDLMVARISSRARFTKYDVQISEWQLAGLLHPSIVRLHKINTLSKSLIERKLGQLSPKDWQNIKMKLEEIWSLS